MGPSGFKLELSKLFEIGRLADYSEEEILAAIEYKLRAESSIPQPPLSPSSRLRGSIKPADMDDTVPIDDEDPQALVEDLLERARVSEGHGDPEAAIKLTRRALAVTPQDSPEQVEAIQRLAHVLQLRYGIDDVDTARNETVKLLWELESARRHWAS